MSAFDENPFADPSVQQATTAGGTATASLDNYDPFSKEKQRVAAVPPSQPAVMSPTQDPAPPKYTPTAQQTATNADFQRRQEELERKAAELSRREEELKNSPYNARVNNWPPLPSFMPCQPCFYQDINVDIPVEFQEMVKRLYYLWLFHALLMVCNIIGGLCFLFAGQDKGSMFGLGLVYGVFFVPLSFLCWFRPAYKFIFSCVMALGIPGSGGSGIISAIGAFTDKDATGGTYFVGFIVMCIAVGFCVAALADFFMLTKIHGYYRATGASLSKAQAEFTTNVLSNEGVRTAAAQAAAAGVRQGFQGGNQQQPQAPRY
jgi:hypothetical protein